MNGRKLLYLVGILFVAVFVIVLNEGLNNKSPSDESLKFFPGISEKDISAVVIKDAMDSVKIRKKGDIWVVSPLSSDPKSDIAPVGADPAAAAVKVKSEYPADSASVAAVLEKLVSMKKGELISTNPAKQSIFEVDSSKGILVELMDLSGTSKGSFRIGKNGPDWSSNYVRMIGSNSVYMVSGSIRSSFFTDNKRWRDKYIIKFDKSTAKRITLVKKDGSSVAVAKADTGNSWNIVEPVSNPAKTDQVDEILNTLSRFVAADFEETGLSDSALGFTSPELAAVVTFGNGSTKKILVGIKNQAGKYPVRAEGKETVFLVDESEFNKINKDTNALKAEVIKADSTKTGSK